MAKIDGGDGYVYDVADSAAGIDGGDGYIYSQPEEKKKSSALQRLVADPALTAAKGVIGLGESAVGLADIVSAGRAGQALEENIGYRPKEAKQMLTDMMTPEQQAASKNVEQAQGFTGTLKAIAENPSVVPHAVIESLPSMYGGAAAARTAIQRGVPALAAAAGGEGLVGGGQAAESIRQEVADGSMTPEQILSAVGSGVGTGVLGYAGGALARKLNIGDIDVMVAEGKLTEGVKKGFLRKLAEGGISEGLFEEMPQSMQEQAWQNFAMGRPLMEGVPEAGAMGLVTGAAMGGVAGGLTRTAQPPATPPDTTPITETVPAATAAPEAADALQRVAGLLPAPGNVSEQNPYGSSGQASIELADASREVSLAGAAVTGMMNGATDAEKRAGSLLFPFATKNAANKELAQRQDAENLEIVPHPTVAGRFAIVPRPIQSTTNQGDSHGQQRQGQETPEVLNQAAAQQTPPASPKAPTAQPASPTDQFAQYLKQKPDGRWTLTKPIDDDLVRTSVIAELDRRNGAQQDVTQTAQTVQGTPPVQEMPQKAPQTGAVPGELTDVRNSQTANDSTTSTVKESLTPAAAPSAQTVTEPSQGISVEFAGNRYPVASIQDAVDKWKAFRETTGGGASEIGNGIPIYENGKQVARISYNGRVWDMQDKEIVGADTTATNPLQAQYDAAKARGDNAEMRRLAHEINQAKQKAEPKKQPETKQPDAPNPYGKVGVAPGGAQDVSLKDNGDGTATVMRGDEPFVDYDSGEDVTVKTGATPQEVRKAVEDAKAVSNREKWFGVEKAAAQAPGRESTTEAMQKAMDKVGADKFEQYVKDHLDGMGELSPEEHAAEIEGVARRINEGAYDEDVRNSQTANEPTTENPVVKEKQEDTQDTLRKEAISLTAAKWHARRVEALITRFSYTPKDAADARKDPVDWAGHQDFLETALENGEVIPQEVLDDYAKNDIKPDPKDWPLLAKKLEVAATKPTKQKADDGAAQKQQEAAPPASNEASSERKKDAKGFPIYANGDRVEYVDGNYAGRHGAISEATAIRSVVLGFGGRGYSQQSESVDYYYRVKTDNGGEFTASAREIKFEEAKPASVVPDIDVDGYMQEPEAVLRSIQYAKQSAEKSRAAAQRARKSDMIAKHKRSAQTQDEKAAKYQAAFDAWSEQHPAEAEKIAPKPTVAQQATVAGQETVADVATTLKAAGLTVTKTTTKNGKPVWEVGGNTREHSDMLKRIGGRWYGPKKVWSFYNDDPTAAITEKLGGAIKVEEPKILGRPAIEMPDSSLENFAKKDNKAGEVAREELAKRDEADEVDLGQMFDDVLAEETAQKKEAWPGLSAMEKRDNAEKWWKELTIWGRRNALDSVGATAIGKEVLWNYLPPEVKQKLQDIIGTAKDPIVADGKASPSETVVFKANQLVAVWLDGQIQQATVRNDYSRGDGTVSVRVGGMVKRVVEVAPSRAEATAYSSGWIVPDDVAANRETVGDSEDVTSKTTLTDIDLGNRKNHAGEKVTSAALEIRKHGRDAFLNGEKRVAPDFFAPASAKEWYRGWDEANAAAPVAAEKMPEPKWWSDLTGAERYWRLGASGIPGTASTPWSRFSAEQQQALDRQWKPRPDTRTAGEAAASAVKNTAAGLADAIDGLGKLFGSNGSRLSSGLSFDENTYAQAKPLFAQAIAHFKDAGQDLKEVMRAVVRMVLEKFGPQVTENMKPYVIRFMEDVKAGNMDYDGIGGKTDDSGTQSQSSGTLEDLPAKFVGGTDGRGQGGSGANASSYAGGSGDTRVDGEGGATGRSGGNGAAAPDLPATGDGRPGRGRGRGTSAKRGGVPKDNRADDAQPGRPGDSPAVIPSADYVIGADVALGSGGQMTKYRDNVAAIRLIKQLEAEKRRATAAEQRTLARYVGWGGIPNAFRNPVTGEVKDDWKAEVEELETLLTPKELRAASASTPNAHYTAKSVVDFMWRAAARMGFAGGLVLEPSVGSGNFIGLMPDFLRGSSHVTGIELDSLTSRIAGALYPRSNIVHSGFEKLPLPDDTFDLAIGNPPFGRDMLRFAFKPELNGATIHNQFFRGSMDAVKPGGLQIMVVSRFLLDAQDQTNRLELAKDAKLLGAIRLPGAAFKGNALTEVVTDIIFLQKRTATESEQIRQAIAEKGKKEPKNETPAARNARWQRESLLNEAMEWVETGTIADPLGGEAIPVNRYFVDNPHMIAGSIERSGSMRVQNDIDVKLRKGETIEQAMDNLMRYLPGEVAPALSDEVKANTEERHRLLGEALKLYATGAEVGAIRYEEDGTLSQVVERVGEDGSAAITKITLSPNTPWSPQLAMGLDGKWFREVPKLNDKGEKVKKVVNGRLSKANVYIREVFEKDADVPDTLRLGESKFERIKELIRIRDLLVEQLSLETTAAPVAPMEENRGKLRAAYEAFVKKHGFISEPKNAAVVADMPDEGLLLSLESGFKREVTAAKAKATGMKPAPAHAKPAAILSRPVGIPQARPDHADNINDALALSLAETGKLDIDLLQKLRGLSKKEVENELTDGDAPLAFADPELGFMLVDKNAYLSGNVRRKLEAARQAGMEKNVKALEAVQPELWTSDQVTPRLGGVWIPTETYAEFVTHLLKDAASVTFSKKTNTFQVYAESGSAAATSVWGTKRYPAPALLQDALNSRRIAVYDTDSDGVAHFNQQETDAALDKRREILEAFDGWIFNDSERRRLLTQRFNDAYNVRVNRQHDGSHMTFPGKVPDEIISLRRGQVNAIWRGIVENFVLYDHAVGAGKTFTGIARAMERRRMGLSRKPMIVVPNHLVQEWLIQTYRLYPGAKVLAAGKQDMTTKNRRRMFAKIATGDWDLVIVPHSSFGFINLSPETEERFLMQEMVEAEAALKEAEEEDQGGGRFKSLGVKAAEALIKKIETRLEALRTKGRDKLLTFEQMGVDDLTVDESHEFKNLMYSSNLTDVRGMGNKTGSSKALDLYVKTRVLHENGGAIAFMTGTPISNSAVEMYNIMRYLAPDVLEEMGLEHFDAYRTQFVEATGKFEPTDSGSGLKLVTRLGRSWSNMRSLMDAYYAIADVVTNEDIKKWYAEDNPGQEFPLPNVKGGERKAIAVQPTPTQERLLNGVIAGFNGLDSIADVKERNKERLRLMDQARKVSLHAKAVNPSVTDEPGGKLDRVVGEVKRIYDQWSSDKGTQLIFLDRGVPKSKGDAKIIKEYDDAKKAQQDALAAGDEVAYARANDRLEKFDAEEIKELRLAQAGGWSAYQHIKDGLVAQGIPAEEIAFIQNYSTDADKEALFGAVRDGSVRVLIGSTPRMGAGTNVQERLVGLHHVDVTWKPSDIEQREGRIIRQGNALYEKYGKDFEVEILAYVTERTVDAKLWELNSMKLRMINAIRHYDGAFEMDFNDEDSVGMAEIAAIASGDPVLLERFKLMAEVDGLYRQRRSFNRRRDAAQDALEAAIKARDHGPAEIERYRAEQAAALAILRRALEKAEARKLSMLGKTYSGTQVNDAKYALEIEVKKQRGDDEKAPFKIEINGKEYTSSGGAEEAITLTLGDADPFYAEVGGKEIIRRSDFARAIRDVVGVEFAPTDEERPVGSLFGIPVSVETEDGNFGQKFITLRGTAKEGGVSMRFTGERDLRPQKYKPGDVVDVTVTGLRPVITQFGDAIAAKTHIDYIVDRLEKRIASAGRDIPDLEAQLQEKFKHAEALEEKTQRLRAVEQELAARAKTNNPQQQEEGGGMFRRASSPVSGTIDAGTLSTVIDRVIAASPRNFSREAVVTAPTFQGLPVAIIRQAAQEGYDQNGRKANGDKVTGVTYKGKVYVVQANISSELEAEETLLHERIHQIVHGNAKDSNGIALRKKLNMLYLSMGGRLGVELLAKDAGVDISAALEAADKLPSHSRPAFITEEFLAHAEGRRAYETLPQKYQRNIREWWGFFRNWLNESGFARLAEAVGIRLGDFTTADLAWTLKGIRQSDVTAGDSAIRFMASSIPNREDYTREGFAANVLQELAASEPEVFRYPTSAAGTLQGVFKDVFPGVEYYGEHTRTDEKDETGADHRFIFTTPESKDGEKGKEFRVYTTDSGRIWIDVQNLKPGDQGSRIYHAVANYAHNARKVFGGDPIGVSPAAMIARTKMMLSSMLRFGTARHLDAANEQIKGLPLDGIPPLDWRGTDIEKLRSLIHTYTAFIAKNAPDLRHFVYDFAQRKFLDTRTGREFRPSFAAFDAALGKDQRDAAGIGADSGRAAIVIQSLIREEGRSVGDTGILQAVLNHSSALVDGGMAGMFNRTKTREIIGDSGRQYTQEQLDMFSNVGRERDKLTTFGKLQKFFNQRWVQGVVDQFAPFRELDMKAYTLMRLSKGWNGAVEAFLKHGKLSLRDGAYDADTTGGLIDTVFSPIGAESTDFLYWVAGNRAEKLMAQDRENLFTEGDIAAAKSLARGDTGFDYTLPGGKVTRNRNMIYRDTLRKFNEFHKNALDITEQSGLIDSEARSLWENEFYVPFYRVIDGEDEKVRGGSIKQGLVRQEAFKKLKGGKDGLNDLLANTLMNFAHLIDASAKNRAAKAAIEAAENHGIAIEAEPKILTKQVIKGDTIEREYEVRAPKGAVWFMDGGEKRYFIIDDPAVMEAITGLDYSGLRGIAMDMLSKPKHWLTIGVTANPFFKIRNLIRDSMSAIATSDLSYNPVKNVTQGWKLTNRESQEYVSALAGGGLIRFGTMLEGNEVSRTRQLIKQGVNGATILDSENKLRKFYDKVLEPAVAAYNELGNRGEEINRMALYDQLVKQGIDHATASLMARDLLDFSLQGSFTGIRFLSQVVPFFNARLQGLYKLGRASQENTAHMATMVFSTALFGLALMALYSDDDDWKKREEWDIDNYWWFKFGGIAYRIPKPFELGAVATMAERVAMLMFDQRMTGERFRKSMVDLVSHQLSMNPIPQAFKPIIDIYANKDSFTGRPIEPMGMDRLDPAYRYTANTTLPARGVSAAMGGALSPVQVDHLIRGYFGWLGVSSVEAANFFTLLASNEPTKPKMDALKKMTGGMAADVESGSSRYVSYLYDQAKKIEQAYATASKLRREGRTEEAKQYAADHMDDLRNYKRVEMMKEQMTRLNGQIRIIERSDMHPAEKRVRIRRINELKGQIAERLQP